MDLNNLNEEQLYEFAMTELEYIKKDGYSLNDFQEGVLEEDTINELRLLREKIVDLIADMIRSIKNDYPLKFVEDTERLHILVALVNTIGETYFDFKKDCESHLSDYEEFKEFLGKFSEGSTILELLSEILT